jgi:hypothetical protein
MNRRGVTWIERLLRGQEDLFEKEGGMVNTYYSQERLELG